MNKLYNLAPTSNGKFEDLPAPSSLGGVETLRISEGFSLIGTPTPIKLAPLMEEGIFPALWLHQPGSNTEKTKQQEVQVDPTWAPFKLKYGHGNNIYYL